MHVRYPNYHADGLTQKCFGYCKTISGGCRYFGPSKKSTKLKNITVQLKLKFDCDQHTLELCDMEKDEMFWKVKILESNWELQHFPYLALYEAGVSVKIL